MSSFEENYNDNEDVQKNKVAAILAYFIFFIPLILAPKSVFARFHANQGLVLCLTSICLLFVSAIIPFIGPKLFFPIGELFVFVSWIIGIINAVTGKMKKLPLIGAINILNR